MSVPAFLAVTALTVTAFLGAGAIAGALIGLCLNERDDRRRAHHEACMTATPEPPPSSSSTRSWP